jgi:hypothetical protein
MPGTRGSLISKKGETMFYQNDFIAKNIKKQQTDEYVRQAEQDRLIARLNSQRPNRILQLARGIGRVMGHLLLAADRRLDKVQAPESRIRIGKAVTGK